MKNMFTKYVRIRKELCNMNTDKEFDRELMSFLVGRQVVGRQEVGRQLKVFKYLDNLCKGGYTAKYKN